MYFDMNLKRFKPPAHRWRMNWRMRAVYRELPRCPARVLAPDTPSEPSPSPEIEPGSSPEATSEATLEPAS
jgi:hypothetical protein